MEKIKKQFNWLFFNGLFLAAIYYGLFEGINGAKNIAIFVAWLTFIISLSMLHDDVVKIIKKNGKYMPQWVDAIFDICVICSFLWFGYFITAIAYLISVLITHSARSKAFGDDSV